MSISGVSVGVGDLQNTTGKSSIRAFELELDLEVGVGVVRKNFSFLVQFCLGFLSE